MRDLERGRRGSGAGERKRREVKEDDLTVGEEKVKCPGQLR